MRDLSQRAQEKWAFLRRSDRTNRGLAIFVHGFRGNYLTTWGALSDLLAQHADSDNDFCNWDYVFLGYNTGDVRSYLDIAALICGAWRRASEGEAPYGQKYQRLALFGHSLGTLGIRQALCANSTHGGNMLTKLHSVTLFGSPLNGSRLAFVGSLVHPISSALKPANPQLRMLKAWSESAQAFLTWPKVRVVLGQGDWVVGSDLAELVQWPGDLEPEQTVLNHSDLAKPTSWGNSAFIDIVRMGLR